MKTNNLLLVLLLASVVIFSGCTDSPSSESTGDVSTPDTSVKDIDSIKASALEVPYEDLYRYNENYDYQIVYYRGEVLQIGTEDEFTYWRIATEPSTWGGYMDDVIMVVAEDYSGVRLLEGDIIDVWGESGGLYTYEALMGNEVTIPILYGPYIEFVEEDMQEPTSFIVSEKGTYDNPAGIQESVICSYSDKTYDISVLDVVRGSQANNIITEANMFNDEAPNGYEYVLVKMKFHYSEGTEAFDATPYDFKAFCEGVECDDSYVVLPDSYNEFSSGTVMPGGTKEGWLVFTVPSNEEVLISYQENMYLETPVCYINIGY
jgi:hypothetical protein